MTFEAFPVSSALSSVKLKLLLFSTPDACIRACDVERLQVEKAVIPCKAPPSVMLYVKRLNFLLLGSTKGLLTIINCNNFDKFSHVSEVMTAWPEGTQLREVMVHEDAITGMDTDHSLQLVSRRAS